MKRLSKYLLSEFKKANTLPKNFSYFFTGSGFFLIFLVILALEAKRVFGNFDEQTTLYLQSVTPRTLDIPLSILSLLGSFEVTTLLVLLLALWVFRREKKIFFALVFFGVILMFEFIGKLGLYHPGPPQNFFRYTLPFSFPTSYVSTNSSFPSGHVSRTLFLMVVSSFLIVRYLKVRWVTVAAVLYALVMIVSRIYLGEHWASDTLGGLFLGLAMGFFAVSYF
ncbi:phosphatase PAP2 family protein [Patescibacteria group bacterium]|nr:phosphatase PAP2 family protein [Patescibacteria group bacterium]